jgi:hypothetical protein
MSKFNVQINGPVGTIIHQRITQEIREPRTKPVTMMLSEREKADLETLVVEQGYHKSALLREAYFILRLYTPDQRQILLSHSESIKKFLEVL